jgi:probable rRNA maturation factor
MDGDGSTRSIRIEVPADTAALAVDVADATGRLTRMMHQWVTRHAVDAGAYLRATGEVRVRVVGDDEMAAAHIRWSGVEGTTDVLTFDMGTGGSTLDVDVLVCLDEAERNAVAHGTTPERELLLYIVHAMLHCLGHDDVEDSAAAAMHAREDAVLAAIGVGAVYSARAGGTG